MTYQVQGSPVYIGAATTLVIWMAKAPMPCFDVSYHHVSHDRRTLRGSQKRLPVIHSGERERETNQIAPEYIAIDILTMLIAFEWQYDR